MFASKTTNRGKLDSHCWFFDGFAYLLQPDYCVLFDAGGCAVRDSGARWRAAGGP
jgi:cellulose synthase/poly-beta-1,6-N-acetylglucosamine synthase-like glycosyltransferase